MQNAAKPNRAFVHASITPKRFATRFAVSIKLARIGQPEILSQFPVRQNCLLPYPLYRHCQRSCWTGIDERLLLCTGERQRRRT